jgi:hypothetical protein
MLERRSSRFAIEVLVLVALAVSVAVAHVNRVLIGGVMLAGWLIVSLLEWASLRSEPHFGAGMPPRYYQPQVRLPPPRPSAESSVRYVPVHAAEAPTQVVAPPPAWPSQPAVAVSAPPAVVAPEPVWEAPMEEPAVAESDDRAELLGGVELGAPIEFAHAGEEREPVAAFALGDESPFEIWQELPAGEPEPEPVLEALVEIPQETGGDIVPELWPELPANFFVQPPIEEPAVEEPVAEDVLPELEPEPELDPMPFAQEPTRDEPELAQWFDVQLPAPPAPIELEPIELAELPAWAFEDTDSDAEREDELAAQEILPEEIEPLLDVPLGEPLPEEASTTSWFDQDGGGLVYSDYDESEQSNDAAAPVSTGEPSGSAFAAGPLHEYDLPQSDIELDILIGRLAGAPLGEDTNLMSWFDAQLPGAVVAAQAEPSLEAAPAAFPEDGAVGGWLLEPQAPLDSENAAPESSPATDAWEQEITAESSLGLVDAVADGTDMMARHSIDPLAAGDDSSRRFGRKPESGAEHAGTVEVPARPAARLLLPGRAKRDT